MAYLKKNIEALIDLKITDRGRQLISMAEFSDIEYFQIGDSEYDYNNRIINDISSVSMIDGGLEIGINYQKLLENFNLLHQITYL